MRALLSIVLLLSSSYQAQAELIFLHNLLNLHSGKIIHSPASYHDRVHIDGQVTAQSALVRTINFDAVGFTQFDPALLKRSSNTHNEVINTAQSYQRNNDLSFSRKLSSNGRFNPANIGGLNHHQLNQDSTATQGMPASDSSVDWADSLIPLVESHSSLHGQLSLTTRALANNTTVPDIRERDEYDEARQDEAGQHAVSTAVAQAQDSNAEVYIPTNNSAGQPALNNTETPDVSHTAQAAAELSYSATSVKSSDPVIAASAKRRSTPKSQSAMLNEAATGSAPAMQSSASLTLDQHIASDARQGEILIPANQPNKHVTEQPPVSNGIVSALNLSALNPTPVAYTAPTHQPHNQTHIVENSEVDILVPAVVTGGNFRFAPTSSSTTNTTPVSSTSPATTLASVITPEPTGSVFISGLNPTTAANNTSSSNTTVQSNVVVSEPSTFSVMFIVLSLLALGSWVCRDKTPVESLRH